MLSDSPAQAAAPSSDPRAIRRSATTSPSEYWAAYFAPADPARQTVDALDVAGGIDVIRIDRPNARVRVRAPDRELRRDGSGRPHPLFGYACPLRVQT